MKQALKVFSIAIVLGASMALGSAVIPPRDSNADNTGTVTCIGNSCSASLNCPSGFMEQIDVRGNDSCVPLDQTPTSNTTPSTDTSTGVTDPTLRCSQ